MEDFKKEEKKKEESEEIKERFGLEEEGAGVLMDSMRHYPRKPIKEDELEVMKELRGSLSKSCYLIPNTFLIMFCYLSQFYFFL